MESSIAEFLERQLACELLPTAYHDIILHYYMPNTTQTLDNTPCSALKGKTPGMALPSPNPSTFHLIPSRPFGYDQV